MLRTLLFISTQWILYNNNEYFRPLMAIGSVVGLLGGGLAWLVGWVASQAGLPAAMWLLVFGPVSLVLFVPRAQPIHE